jgi:integrase
MATVSTDHKGRRAVQFFDQFDTRRTLRLGNYTLEQARAVGKRVEELVGWRISGEPPSKQTLTWLRNLPNRQHARLARFDLVEARQIATIGDWLERYIRECEDDMKPESVRKLRQTRTKLLEHFDQRTPLRTITVEQAEAWRSKMKDDGLKRATIRTHCGNVKTMMRKAVKRRLIDQNPFEELESGATASKYTRYVTPEEIERVIEASPNGEWRLLFGLARYAGLRIPSESHILTWADVDWQRARLTVRSPKTEHHEGHEQRVVPIAAPLMPLLLARFDECETGDELLITIRGKGAMVRRIRTIWAQAGVEPWKRLWQTLRSSCEKQWAMTLPQFAVSRWIGHSIEISGKHYANAVPDELFDRATSASRAAYALQNRPEPTGTGRKRKRKNPVLGHLTADGGVVCNGAGGSRTPVRKSQGV